MTLAFPAPTSGTRHPTGLGRAVAAPRSPAAALPENLELLPLPEAMALLGRQQWLTARLAQHWQYVARRLHQHRGNAALRARAAAVTDLFTGSSVGVIAALWTQEREQQRAQLRAQAATCWSQLRNAPDAALASNRLRTIRLIDAQLRGLDRFDRAVSAGDVLALSQGAGIRIGEIAERRVATDRVNPESRPVGFAWLPSRQAFVGWLADAQHLEVFQISAAEMAGWVRSLRTADPQTLTWSRRTIAIAATDLAGRRASTRRRGRRTASAPLRRGARRQRARPGVGAAGGTGRRGAVDLPRADHDGVDRRPRPVRSGVGRGRRRSVAQGQLATGVAAGIRPIDADLDRRSSRLGPAGHHPPHGCLRACVEHRPDRTQCTDADRQNDSPYPPDGQCSRAV